MRHGRERGTGPRRAAAAAGRAGFALPIALLAMMIIGVLVTGAFYATSRGERVAHGVELASEALYVAEFGLEETIGTWSNAAFDSVETLKRYEPVQVRAVSGELMGEYELQVRRIGDRLFLLTSIGVVRQDGRDTEREVATMVRTTAARLPRQSALTTLGGIELRGSARVSGSDAGGPECGRADDAAGIATRRADAVVVRGGGVDRVEGEPAMLEDAALDTAAIRRFGTVHLSELIAAADVVYEDGVDLPGLRPAFRGQGAARACEVSNARNWGEPTGKGPCGDYVPVIYAGGDTHVRGGAGQGLLIVDGDLRLSGNVWFRGVIIVTGVLRADGGRHRIEGGVVLLDGSRRRTSVLGDGSSIQYSECLVQRALSGTTRPNPVRNRSWVDVTASKLGRLPEQRTGGDEGA